MKRLLWIVVSALALSCLFPALAAAQSQRGTIEFQRLRGSVNDGQLTVRYAVEPRSWRKLKRKDVEPNLNLWVAEDDADESEFRFSYKLRRRKGSLTFPQKITVRHGDRIDLELVGYHRAWRIEQVEAGPQGGAWLTYWIDRGHLSGQEPRRKRRHRRDRRDDERRSDRGDRHDRDRDRDRFDEDARVAVVQACEESLMGDDVNRCVEDAKRIDARWAAGAVKACDDALVGSSNVLDCLDRAAALSYEPAPIIAACEDAFVGSSNALECLDEASTFHAEPTRVIAACEDGFVGSSNALSCMKATAPFRHSAAEVVSACEDATVGSSDTLDCIGAAKGAGRSAPRLIEACSDNSDVAGCVETSSRR